MKKNIIFSLFLTILCVPSLKAQDSLSFTNKIQHQYDIERALKHRVYYNPALMSDYSPLSFSDFQASYQHQKDKAYLLEQGNQQSGLQVKGKSYKRLTNNKAIWGEVVYNNLKQYEVQWNSTLDPQYVGPYTLADSSKGTNKYESYQFSGGVTKTLGRFDLGIDLFYLAQMSHRERDPRPKSTSSDLRLKAGMAYSLFKDYKLGAFAQVLTYKQTTSVIFFSEVARADLYQMNGLGDYNFYFSNKSDKARYSQSAYHTGLSFSSLKEGDFALGVQLGQSNLTKAASTTNANHDINKLKQNELTLYVNKGITIDEHRVVAQITYDKLDKKGSSILYSNVGNEFSKILESQNYKHKTERIKAQMLYQVKLKEDLLSVIPSYSLEDVKESTLDSKKNRDFKYGIWALQTRYIKPLSSKDILTLSVGLQKRGVNKSSYTLGDANIRPSIKEWLDSDYTIYSSEFLCYNASLRYDQKISPTIGGYLKLNYNNLKYKSHKANSFIGFTAGITF